MGKRRWASAHAPGETVTEILTPRARKVKILATLGPASSDAKMIRKLMLAGADAFRINMSHGDQKQKAKLVDHIRALEKEFRRPTTILFDLQGPKLRVGQFQGGRTVLEKGSRFIFDQQEKAGDSKRVQLPHAELFESVRPGTNILIDDGKVRLNVLEADAGKIVTEVKVGGAVSDNKGVNVPDVVVPIPALTDKDRDDEVMLSAESAGGQYPCEAVQMMDRIAVSAERDPSYQARIHFTQTRLEPTTADALAGSARQIASTISATAMLCYTSSGSTARRIARARPPAPLLAMSASLHTARRMGLLWGVHAVHSRDVSSFEEMVEKAKRMALRHQIARGGDRVIVMAGIPLGTAGSTNVLHVVRLIGDDLDRYSS